MIFLKQKQNAFPLHHLPLTHKRGRSTRTSISYKTIDPIEKEQISSSSSNRLGDGDNNDGGALTGLIEVPDVHRHTAETAFAT